MIVFCAVSYSQQRIVISDNPEDQAHPSAILDLISENKGFLLPRMTEEQRNSINDPAESLFIFNTTSDCIDIWVNEWHEFWCLCPEPGKPIAKEPSEIKEFEFTASWSTAKNNSLETHYKVDVSQDSNFSSFVCGFKQKNVGKRNEYVISGLDPETQYYYRVYAENCCGRISKSSNVVSVETDEYDPCDDIKEVAFKYNGQDVVYRTVSTDAKQCWLDRNLGAVSYDVQEPRTHEPESKNDYNFYGDYFQWGRLDDGHQLLESYTTSELSSTDDPGHSSFITTSSDPNDWRQGQNNNLWQNDNGKIINNPCPEGWRLPTDEEWFREVGFGQNNEWKGSDDAFNSDLKLTVTGIKYSLNGLVYSDGVRGSYWSSTVSGINSRYLYIQSNSISIAGTSRASGFSVRCIIDNDNSDIFD